MAHALSATHGNKYKLGNYMARGITEAEYETLRRKASPSVRFSDAPPQRVPRRKAAQRTSRRKTDAGFKEVLPVIGVAALVALMGAFLAGRASAALGDSQDAAYGSDVGTIINTIIPIPGIGEVASFVGGLFGPSTSYTPGGETYCQASDEMHAGYYNMMTLVNEIREKMGLPDAPLLDFVGPGTATPSYSGNVCSHNAAIVGPYFAKLLQNPALASQTSCAQKQTMEANGTFDAAIAMQNQLISHLTYTLYSLESGVLVPSGGRLLLASGQAMDCSTGCYSSCLISPPAQDANSTAAGGQTICPAATAPSCGFSLFGLTQTETIAVAGLGVLGILILVKKMRG
jgi:hypothetical protein